MNYSPPFRSDKVLRHARGQRCTLRFPGICNHNPETTVAAHVRDGHKGMGQKASDHSVCFACSDCHRALDEGFAKLDEVALEFHQRRALVETWAILIADGIIVFPHNLVTPFASKPVKPRKPKAQRRPIQQRSNFPAKGSRHMNRKEKAS